MTITMAHSLLNLDNTGTGSIILLMTQNGTGRQARYVLFNVDQLTLCHRNNLKNKNLQLRYVFLLTNNKIITQNTKHFKIITKTSHKIEKQMEKLQNHGHIKHDSTHISPLRFHEN